MCVHMRMRAHAYTHTHMMIKITLIIRHFPDRSCSIEYFVGRCVLKPYCGTFAVTEDGAGGTQLGTHEQV